MERGSFVTVKLNYPPFLGGVPFSQYIRGVCLWVWGVCSHITWTHKPHLDTLTSLDTHRPPDTLWIHTPEHTPWTHKPPPWTHTTPWTHTIPLTPLDTHLQTHILPEYTLWTHIPLDTLLDTHTIHTVNKQVVCILLECFLVTFKFWK